MSRTISRGTCSTRPGNDALSLELYPLYHAFTSATNLTSVMMEVAQDHSDMARFDPQMMRGLAEEVYSMSADAQAAEGGIRQDNGRLIPALKQLNEMYKWPLLQKTAADWAPLVRYSFLGKEGELLGARPLYGAANEQGMSDDMIRNRLGQATDQQRCRTAEIPLTRWPLQEVAGAPPTFGRPTPMPTRPEPPLGQRGGAPGLVAQTGRVMPGQAATQLCSQGAPVLKPLGLKPL